MANPILNENTFSENYTQNGISEVMTKNGVVTKSLILFVVLVIASAMSWYKALSAPSTAGILMSVGIIGGFISVLVLAFKRQLAAYIAPLYAVFEGLALGALSCYFEAQFPGIVYQAILATFAVFFTLLALYASRVIVVTDKVRGVIFSATLAIFLFYLVSFILSLFKVYVPYINQPNAIGIGFSVFVTIIASANFLIDFDNIERGINYMAPKYFEWYCSFGLLVTFVWVYIEILKLLSLLARRR